MISGRPEGVHHATNIPNHLLGSAKKSSNMSQRASQGALVVKNPPANAGDMRDRSSIPESGRSLGGGNGNPRQYPCLENPMDRGDWRATVHGIAESDTTEVTEYDIRYY